MNVSESSLWLRLSLSRKLRESEKLALLQKFHDPSAIAGYSREDLRQAGLSESESKAVFETFHPNDRAIENLVERALRWAEQEQNTL